MVGIYLFSFLFIFIHFYYGYYIQGGSQKLLLTNLKRGIKPDIL